MPITAAAFRRLLIKTYELFVPKLSEEEVRTLDEIYEQEYKRLRSERMVDTKRKEAALQEVRHTLYTWVEAGLTAVRLAIRISENITIAEIDEALQRIDWFNLITDMVTTKDPGPYHQAGQWGRARNKKLVVIPPSLVPFEVILETAHAIVFIHREPLSEQTLRKVEQARKHGLWVETVDLTKRSKARRKLNDKLAE